MRRIVSDLIAYLSEVASAWRRGWDAFFFRPADPTPLGLVRIAVGLLATWNLAVLGLDLQGWLGANGWADAEVLRRLWAEQSPWHWSVWVWIPDPWLRPAWGIALAVLIAFTLGLWSRVTAVLAWVIVVSTVRRAPVAVFGYDQIVSTWLLYLAVSGASGQALSLDRFFARRRRARAEFTAERRQRPAPNGVWDYESGAPTPSVSANLGLRLIQLHLALIYGVAGLAKLQGPAWWAGVAVWPTLVDAEFSRNFDLTGLAHYPVLIAFLTHATVALEVLYPILIWNRLARPLLLIAAAAMHLGILVSMGLAEFGLAMLAGNLAFVSGRWVRGLVTGPAEARARDRVLFDGACPLCRSSIGWIVASDPGRSFDLIDLNTADLRAIHPSLTPDACRRSMHIVRGRDGAVFAGFDAVARIARRLPPAWPLAVLTFVPGVTPVGRRVYNTIASRRHREVVCSDEVCAVGPATGSRREHS